MNMKKINRFLFCTTVFSAVLFLFSFTAGKKTQVKSVKSALLNPSYNSKISALIIQNPEEVLTLRKQKNFWSAEKSGILTFADTKTVENFTTYLTKIRNLYKISDGKDAKTELNLTEDSATIVTVIDENGRIVSKLYFGADDALTSRITLAAEKGKNCFETEDDFSPYLKTDLDFWAVPEIFFAIKNPSNLNLSPADLHTLQSLRHGKILPSSSSVLKNLEIENSVTLYGQYDSFQRIDFYEYEDAKEGKLYFYTQKIEPQEIKDTAVFEVSSWTYDKIKELLKTKS